MKKLYTTLAVLTLTLTQTAHAFDCDAGETLSVSPTAEATSRVVSGLVEKIYDQTATAELFAAVKAKNIKAVKAALAKNANPNAVQAAEEGQPLSIASYAVKFGTPEILRAILDADGDANIQDQNAQLTTPLMMAARWNGSGFIDVLLDHQYNVDVNKSAAGGRTALHFAATNNSVDAIKKLVAVPSIDLNATSVFVVGKGNTALSSTGFYGNLDGVKALLSHPNTTKPFTVANLDAALSTFNEEIREAGKKEIDAYKAKYYPN